ncbi:MAG: YfcL protein [Idiomarinaceae bacterium HL-53]|nr:MAG: YfcL protein [Idiomarinaceae bacterium HL-53]CUS49410.1 YfcL protein [Idiomarinaceae bacterium HL-53]
MSKLTIAEMADQLDAVFDQIVQQGNDDELFASGYLRGHFDLVVAKLTMAEEDDTDLFWQALEKSLADSEAELKTIDRDLVQGMLNRLKKTVNHPAMKG